MFYYLDAAPVVNLPKDAEHPVIGELLGNYTFGKKWKISLGAEENTVTVGEYTCAERGEAEYVLNITDKGIYIEGADRAGMMHGFFSMLEGIKYDDGKESFYLEAGCAAAEPVMKFRCVHICVFPETRLDFVRKCIRACAAAKYSHIILEFWGMFKYDCLSELSWSFAYTKEELKPIIDEGIALGLEFIPMFNHLGHASACREVNGKHVVLDQNIKYEYMFESYGWVWNIKRGDVRGLLAKVRSELIELFGKGSYFHIGCDEAYAYGKNPEKAHEMAKYINEVAAELKKEDRRLIMWHDMLLPKSDFAGYEAASTKEVSDILLSSIDKSVLVADWEYAPHAESWKTSAVLKEHGFDVVCCPWQSNKNIKDAVNTAKEHELFGIIHTTWHTLYQGFRAMVYDGVLSYGAEDNDLDDVFRFYAASIVRKTSPSYGDYKKTGWSEEMTGPGL